MNLSDAVNLFINQTHLKSDTRKAYKQVLNALLSYIGPARPLTDLSPVDIQKFWNHFTARKWSPFTINKHIKSLKAFCNWCVKMRLIEHSPADAIKRPRLPNVSPRLKAMTNEEYQTLLNYARQTSPRNYALLLFLGDTGVRAISASRLRRADINLDDHSATITGKGDVTRTVYFGDMCALALRDWMRMKKLNTTDYVFRERGKSGKVKSDNISQIVRRLCYRAGLDRSLGSHSLRHRKGHQLADSGTPITVSARVLGHANTQTTQIYYPDDDERVRAKMESLSTGHVDSKPIRKIIPLIQSKKST